ncbi:MAG: prolyl oligopeptidase family serine peptidase, partial [Alistipes sp.]|nr:prolyl oligopeptidase family serine peptidase [Alistipes sp.]
MAYTIGEPSQSCYDAVVSGVEYLIESGIADPKRIGLCGHSWGGYQVADLVTRTNLFCCASPGAAVTNLTSSYLALRGRSGVP